MRIKQWNEAEIDEKLVKEISDATNLPELACRVLAARAENGNLEDVISLLDDDIEFESPFNLKDMNLAVDRIHTAIENDEKIVVYGDYDCDGITSTALLYCYFQSIGVDIDYYIPHREEEGYGMNTTAVSTIHRNGGKLIITVDNGISSHTEIAYAKSLGIDTIVTDHHTPMETLPDCVAVINPHRKDCPSRFKYYAGVGVAYQLICALEDAQPEELLEFYSDLVALGTVADLVPLYKENRRLVKVGVEQLAVSHRPGIQALIEEAQLSFPISSENVSFGLAPRINAAGRMGEVDQAVELLITDDYQRAVEIASSLQELNLRRRGEEEKVIKEIYDVLRAKPELLQQRMLIVWGEGWHQGVMGIVASRLLDRFGKPTLLFSINDGIAKGSGRSLEGFSLIDAITNCSEDLTQYGGHVLAAGLTIKEEHLDKFYNCIQNYAKENYSIMPVPGYNIDCPLSSNDLTVSNIQSLDALAPFGAGNSSPIFVLRGLNLTGIYPTSDQKHLRLRFSKGGRDINTIYFRMAEERFPYQTGMLLDAVVDIDINEWNGSLQLSIKIKDLRPSNYPEQEGIISSQKYLSYKRGENDKNFDNKEILPTRDELETVYKFLRSKKEYSYGVVPLWEELLPYNIDIAKLYVILDIFTESGLIARQGRTFKVIPQKQKVDLKQTPTYQRIKLS